MSDFDIAKIYKPFSQADREKLSIFLYDWYQVKGLRRTAMTREVIHFIQVQFNCQLKDFIDTLHYLEVKQYIDNPGEVYETCQFTKRGYNYITDMINKHGRLAFNISWE